MKPKHPSNKEAEKLMQCKHRHVRSIDEIYEECTVCGGAWVKEVIG